MPYSVIECTVPAAPGVGSPITAAAHSVQRLIGFGAPFGRTDEQWAGLMTTAFRSLKTLRVK